MGHEYVSPPSYIRDSFWGGLFLFFKTILVYLLAFAAWFSSSFFLEVSTYLLGININLQMNTDHEMLYLARLLSF